MTDSNAQITDTYTYDAFGNLIDRTGSTENDYLYSGEQYDPNLGFYYNRARYLDTDAGRFVSQDTYEGDNYDPRSLHKYLYVGNDPVNFGDPTGLYTQRFGYDVEREVRPIYERDNPGDVVSFGGWARLDGGYRLKPDILNHTKQRFVEIKPLSLSGLVAGGIQMQIYTVIFGMSGYLPHIEWFPSENLIFVQGQPVTIVNVGGLLLYTDEQRLFEEFAVLTTLAAAKELLALRAAGEFARIAQLARLATSAAQVGLETETTLACATARF